MRLEELTDQIAPEWRAAFVQFIRTGDASDDFLAYLDSDPACQEAVEAAFAAQSEAFRRFAKLASDPDELAAAVQQRSSEVIAEDPSASLAAAADLDDTQQEESVG